MSVPTTPGTPPTGDTSNATYLPWLAVTAVAYALTHHIGFGLAWLGNAGETRWADWVDIITPYAVLLPAAAALRAGGAAPRLWILYLAGALTYVEGHGIHLAANSVSNAEPSDLVHLWDEVVGHYLWYGGLAVVFAALGAALAHRPPARGPWPALLGLITGVTFTTNALEGGTAVAGIAVAAAFVAWGWRTRGNLGRIMIYTFAPALLLLSAYGIMHGGFPEPSDIGWV